MNQQELRSPFGPRPRKQGVLKLISDLFAFTAEEKKWWLLPFLIVVLMLAGLLTFVMLSGSLAPFIYPLL